jgi:hypothetical protein
MNLILLIEIAALVLALVALLACVRKLKSIDRNIQSLEQMLSDLMNGWGGNDESR